ncbi:fungal specific transcription factor domain-containing protein [Aspergillus foveolatus]|uniref:fungal specific transcription factor domain-containing protein n=1 Tax=Aspergillus foveolatus TaxID=210207 RepID=UPI003CCCB3D5
MSALLAMTGPSIKAASRRGQLDDTRVIALFKQRTHNKTIGCAVPDKKIILGVESTVYANVNQEYPVQPVFRYPVSRLNRSRKPIVPHFASPSVGPTHRARLLDLLARVADVFPNPALPSTSAPTRYLAGYFTGFYPHTPFTHDPKFRLEACSPELCLAVVAVEAIDRFETASATQLFYYAKSLLLDTQGNRGSATSGDAPSIDGVRYLLCLAHFATWQSNPIFRNEATILQSLLVQVLRLNGLDETPRTLQDGNWEHWAKLQSIAFDVPPSIWCDEINLKLPCSCPEWTAPDASTWHLLKQNTPRQGEQDHFPMPAGNYVLMHGLLQKVIWTPRFVTGNLSLANDHRSLFEYVASPTFFLYLLVPGSLANVVDPNGPLPYASTALLSLAFTYVRNCADDFQSRKIFTWAPAQIAQRLRLSPPLTRRWRSLLAAYHATNLLATLAKLGFQYVKQNQSILWSIEEKWLRCVQGAMPRKRLLDWINDVVYESLSSVNDCSFDNIPRPAVSPDQIVTVLSHIMQGNSPYPFIKLISQVLVGYQRLCAGN